MTKYFCDKCGKEVSDSIPTMWHVHGEAHNTGTYFDFDICSECMLELTKLLDSNAESEDKCGNNTK